jgi:hypothetical protein
MIKTVPSILAERQIGIKPDSRKTRLIKFNLTMQKLSVVASMKNEPTTSAPRIYPAILIFIHFNTIPTSPFYQIVWDQDIAAKVKLEENSGFTHKYFRLLKPTRFHSLTHPTQKFF